MIISCSASKILSNKMNERMMSMTSLRKYLELCGMVSLPRNGPKIDSKSSAHTLPRLIEAQKIPPILSLNLHFLSLLGLGAKMGKRNVFLIEAATFFLRPDFESENVPRVSSLSEQAPDTTTIPSHLKQLSRIGNDFREILFPKWFCRVGRTMI